MDVISAPANIEDFYRDYGGYVKGLVCRMGIPQQEAPDVAADIMARFYERDLIGMFDPDKEIVRNGEVIPAKFRSFLSANVSLYVRGKRDALNRRDHRELLIADQPVEEGGTSWMEAFGAAQWDDYSQVAADDFIVRTRDHLARVAPRNTRDNCNLIELFDEMVEQVKETGAVSFPALQEKFQISSTSAYAWVAWLRECLSDPDDLIAPASHVIGAVTLTGADVAEAIKILKEAKGVMVKQPLARAGHKLADADSGWYHEITKSETLLYPALARIPGTHTKPKDHVKQSVLHYFERILGRTTPEPVMPDLEEPTPWDLLEAELFTAGLRVEAVDRILARVQAVVAA